MTEPLIIVFDTLQIFGLVSHSAILCTVWFSTRIRRSTSWFSFNFACILSCISYLLIIGRQIGPPPGRILCLCQAMLIYASPILTSFTFLALMLEIYLSILFFMSRTTISRISVISSCFIPYGAFTGVLVGVFIFGFLNPTTVRRAPDGMYCHLSIQVLGRIISAVVVCNIVAFLILGVCITLQYLKYRSLSGKTLLGSDTIPLGLILRVGLVCACSTLSVGVAVASSFSSSMRNESDLALAMLPGVVAIIFGSQGDTLSVWMFWRKVPQVPPTSTTPTTPTESETCKNVEYEAR